MQNTTKTNHCDDCGQEVDESCAAHPSAVTVSVISRHRYIERYTLAAWLDAATVERRNAAAESLFGYLMSDRLYNYGYDWRHFRKLQGQRQRVKRRARYCRGSMLHAAPGEGRLSYCPERNTWQYTVGQSQNEEITNLIARLSGYKSRGWLS